MPDGATRRGGDGDVARDRSGVEEEFNAVRLIFTQRIRALVGVKYNRDIKHIVEPGVERA